MLVASLVVAVAGLAALCGGLLSRSDRIAADPIDPEPVEHWLLAHARRFPRLHELLTATHRRVFGGIGVAASLLTLLAAGLFVGWVLDTVDTSRGFARWDSAVAEWGAQNATDLSTSLLRNITHGGDTLYLLAAMAFIGVVDHLRHRNPAVFVFLTAVGLGVSLLNNALKWVIERERPAVEHLVGSSGSSFPSGHSAAAAACWAAIALIAGRHLPRRWWPALAALAAGVAAFVAASRALLGVHWLTDVVAGVAVGWAWFFVVAILFGGRILRFGDPAARAGRNQPSAVRTSSSRPTHQGTI